MWQYLNEPVELHFSYTINAYIVYFLFYLTSATNICRDNFYKKISKFNNILVKIRKQERENTENVCIIH